MNKRFKTVSLVLLAMGLPFVAAQAETSPIETIEIVQQNGAATGTVVDASGEALVGASVVVKGTTKGGIVDVDGRFNIAGVKPGQTLRITYIGYEAQEVKWNGSPLSIVLKEDDNSLSEVVITGYGGQQRKTKVTNAISKVDAKALEVGTATNVGSLLSGAVPGLAVNQTSGAPGSSPSIVLRGGTNFDGSGSPLVIVDGQLRGSLSDINPDDIESLQVLKDAGSTAIYGARASNGVILIQTKTGKKGHSEINFKAKLGLNYMNNPYEFLSAPEYITALRTGYMNSLDYAPKGNVNGAQPFGTGNVYNESMKWNVMGGDAANRNELLAAGWSVMKDPLDPTKEILYKETDLAGIVMNNPAFSQDYNVSAAGGNDKGHYYAGIGLNDTEGQPVNSYYKRYSMTFNGDYQVHERIKVLTNFNYNRANWQTMPATQGDQANYFGRLLSLPPTARWADEAGNPLPGTSTGDGNQPYWKDNFIRDNQSDKFTMSAKTIITLYKGLTLTGSGSWYISSQFAESFNHDYQNNTGGSWNRTRSSSASYDRDFRQTYNAWLNYQETFAEKHNVDFMLGMEYYDQYYRGFSASGSGAATDEFQDLELTLNDAGKRSIDSYHQRQRILSYIGRFNYDYDSKYLFSAVFRQDGYSSLINNRWGFFPGVSAGWVFTREDFWKWNDVMDYGKLRASYGINGNATDITYYSLQGKYGNAVYGGNVGKLISTLPNPGLRWEKTKTAEVGVDLGFWNNRLTFGIAYYNRLTDDKYAQLALPTTTGFSSIKNNNGQLRNQGVEIEIGGTIINKGDFRWSAKANIAYNYDKVVKLPDNGLENNRQEAVQVYTGTFHYDENNNKVYDMMWVRGYQEGQRPGDIIGYVFKKIWNDESEIPQGYYVTSGHAQGKVMYGPTAPEDVKAGGIALRAGDIEWEDINGDGHIDQYDQKVLGNLRPLWRGGLNTTLTWKGLSLYVATDFALGFKNYDVATPWFLGCMQGTYNTTTDYYDCWTPDNLWKANGSGCKYPRYVYADQLGAANLYRNSTLFLHNGNYISFREVSLSYSLPKKVVNAFKASKLDLSITGQNLGYLTAIPSGVPETRYSGGIASGIGYPLPRTVIFGASLTF